VQESEETSQVQSTRRISTGPGGEKDWKWEDWGGAGRGGAVIPGQRSELGEEKTQRQENTGSVLEIMSSQLVTTGA
jgi:hypothetical protein